MMRALRIALFCLLAAPSAAHAADAAISHRDLRPGPSRTLASTASPRPFDLVGLHWRGSGTVMFRTRSLSGRWSAWRPAAPEAEDRPDLGAEPERAGWQVGNPWWTGPSDRVQVRSRGRVGKIRAWFVASGVAPRIPLRRVSVVGSPAFIPRSGWKADERIVRGPPKYAPVLRGAVVHHTAGSNDYRREDSAAIVKGIQLYHVKANGWKDVGYNFLVDRFGQVFEGRAGGVDRNVIGAHAQGFNTGFTGIALLGMYSSKAPSKAAEQAIEALLAWRLDVGHVDPAASGLVPSGGNPRFPTGTPVMLDAVSGHRDTGFTACPGDRLYSRLPAMIEVAATTGLPKVYEPLVRGTIGKQVRFSARLSQPLAWTLSVIGPGRKVVARKTGSGDRIAWTWSSAGLPKGRYTWVIEAGPDVRPARGVVGGASLQAPPPPPKLLGGLTVTPQAVSPNGDGFGDVPTVSYTLSQIARVTATITDAGGAAVASLFTDQRQSARPTSFPWPLDALLDGRYTLTISARTDGGTTARQQKAFIVSRTLGWLRADPPSFSPDGDGAADSITFSFGLTEFASVTIEVRQQGRSLATVFAGTLPPGDHAYLWDGWLPMGLAAPGTYEVWVTAVDDVGTVSQSAVFDVTRRSG